MGCTLFPGLKPGDELAARWYEETLTPLHPQAQVAAQFPDGNAAAVLSTFGKGKTLMLGSYLGAAYETLREPTTARFYNALLDWAEVDRTITIESAAEPIEVHWLETGNDTLLFAFNHQATAQQANILLRLPNTPSRATDHPVPLTHQNNHIALPAQIPPHDVRVLKLES